MAGRKKAEADRELEILAEDWIALWQSEIAGLMADPELAQAGGAMAAMSAAWLRMAMPQGMRAGMPSGGMPAGFPFAPPGPAHDRPAAAPPRPAPAAAAPVAGGQPWHAGAGHSAAGHPPPGQRGDAKSDTARLAAQLAERLAELERRLAEVERRPAGSGADRPKPRRRRAPA